MPINYTVGIFGSVGAGGQNQHNDVVAIQTRLNELMHPPRVPLAVDGISGRKTRRMIRDFQKCVCNFNYPDGRVDVAGKTIVALNDPASEGTWARMSIPPDSHTGGGGSGGGQADSDLPKTIGEAVDATLAYIKKTEHMTPGEEAVMKSMLELIFKGQKGGYTDFGPMGLVTQQQANGMFKNGMYIFKVARGVLTFATINTAAWSVAMVLGALAPFLMLISFGVSLKKALHSGGRAYQAVGMSYMTVAWANGDMRPVGCQAFIQNYKTWPEQFRLTDAQMEEHWREGQKSAVAALEDYCRQMAPRAGISTSETQKALKAILSTIDKRVLARSILSDLARKMKSDGDMNAGDSVQRLSQSANYPY